MLPGDRLICAFVEPQEPGAQFTDWPLHVTVMPWFRMPDDSPSVARGLKRALSSLEPFEAVGDGEALFGPKKNRRVRLVTEPTPFSDIEDKVRNYLHKKRAWLVDETTKKKPIFRPHVTVQKGGHLEEGQRFYCDALYIVEQKGSRKEVVARISL